MGIKQQSL